MNPATLTVEEINTCIREAREIKTSWAHKIYLEKVERFKRNPQSLDHWEMIEVHVATLVEFFSLPTN